MDKSEYQSISKKWKVQPRCPLAGYCDRWAWTIFFFGYIESGSRSIKYEHMVRVLQDEGILAPDYEEKHNQIIGVPPEVIPGYDFRTYSNVCPEVALFERSCCPGWMPQEAIYEIDRTRLQGIRRVEYKHFSECLEFIHYHIPQKKISIRRAVSPKRRMEVFQRDGFRCVYCGRGKPEGILLHVDHKISVKDGGTDDLSNLVTACEECNLGKGRKSIE